MAAAHKLLEWYRAGARDLPWRQQPGTPLPADPAWPYRVWLSEIMLQQTTVAAVRGYFAMFTARWPDVAALAAAEDADVMQAWAGLGYYARARNLLACARAVVAGHGGHFPHDEAVLRSLPGIGAYTAAAIAAFAFGRRAIVIDGNVERVVTRLHAIATPLPAARREIHAALVAVTETIADAETGEFAQGLMDLAGRICTPRNPQCLVCPLHADCRAATAGNPEDFPVKPPRRARPLRLGTAWWIEAEGMVLTVTRPPRGLLGGMRALPSSDWRDADTPPLPPVSATWSDLGAVAHGFTHFELNLRVHATRLPRRPDIDGDWVPVATIVETGLPTLFAKAATLAYAQFALQEP